MTIFSLLVSYLLAPFIGWLKFGRYNTLICFLHSLHFLQAYFALLTGGGASTLNNVLLYNYGNSTVLVFFLESCFRASMLPFLTDQLIGATSDELSSVVRCIIGQNCLVVLCLAL